MKVTITKCDGCAASTENAAGWAAVAGLDVCPSCEGEPRVASCVARLKAIEATVTAAYASLTVSGPAAEVK